MILKNFKTWVTSEKNIPEKIRGNGINTTDNSGKRAHFILMGRRTFLKWSISKFMSK